MSDLTLKELSLQLAMLLCLVSVGQRMQTIHLIILEDIKYVEDQVFIPIMFIPIVFIPSVYSNQAK